MGTSIEKAILAIITIDKELVMPGGAPIFLADTKDKQQRTAFLLEKILDGIAHDLENGVMIIVKH